MASSFKAVCSFNVLRGIQDPPHFFSFLQKLRPAKNNTLYYELRIFTWITFLGSNKTATTLQLQPWVSALIFLLRISKTLSQETPFKTT